MPRGMESYIYNISIIIPMYNAEKTIERCIRSVISQTVFSKIEVILIDDGSIDNTYDICSKYTNKYTNIKLIRKRNSGVSDARNIGINNSKATYIQFLDADDFIDMDYCEAMLSELHTNHADLVITGYTQHTLYNKKKVVYSRNDYISNNLLSYCLKNLYYNNIFGYPWNKLYKKEAIKQFFCSELAYAEDYLFNLSYLRTCKSISVIESTGYHYIDNGQGSLSKKYDIDMLYLHLKICILTYQECEKEDDVKQIISQVIEKNFVRLFNTIFYLHCKKSINKEEYIKLIKSEEFLYVLNLFQKPQNIKRYVIWYLVKNKKYRVIWFMIKIGSLFYFK